MADDEELRFEVLNTEEFLATRAWIINFPPEAIVERAHHGLPNEVIRVFVGGEYIPVPKTIRHHVDFNDRLAELAQRPDSTTPPTQPRLPTQPGAPSSRLDRENEERRAGGLFTGQSLYAMLPGYRACG